MTAPASGPTSANSTNPVDDAQKLLATVLQGLKLLEVDSVGGAGSRGYGKVKFVGHTINGADSQSRFDVVKPFEG